MPYRVVVIGAGFGGIGMAIALKRAGLKNFVVLDRADDLGGTWHRRRAPGGDPFPRRRLLRRIGP